MRFFVIVCKTWKQAYLSNEVGKRQRLLTSLANYSVRFGNFNAVQSGGVIVSQRSRVWRFQKKQYLERDFRARTGLDEPAFIPVHPPSVRARESLN